MGKKPRPEAAERRRSMAQFIAFDSHKQYTLAVIESGDGKKRQERKIRHERGAVRGFLASCEDGSEVAVETVGNWYWIVDEIEAAGMEAKLVHAGKAKVMMGMINKTDRLDGEGLIRLQRNGVLPVVWIPPGETRDQRELPRTRMVLVHQRTQLKNRLHATLDKYALTLQGISDIFAAGAREELLKALEALPSETRFTAGQVLEEIEALGEKITELEARMEGVLEESEEIQFLQTIPGVGPILSAVIWLEIGDIERFGGPGKLAAYSGTTPRLHSSGGKQRHGQLRPDVNRYLKWAFMEAANVICRWRKKWPQRHTVRLYERIRERRGHQKAIGAVARHLAEATYWILKKKTCYKEPGSASSTKA
jgi:transposase